MLERLGAEVFDVLVVGGGVTGAGVALDAASRGLSTALVERDDFASGTSSKSSKLVHGGLRYLQQGDVRLVYEALHERQRLRRNAPHLVSVLPFMIPILGRPERAGDQPASVVNRKIARALGSAMWMYDLTGGWRIGKLHRRLRPRRALEHMPTMHANRVVSAYLYYDAAVDDARLVLNLVRTAADHGAVVTNGTAVASVERAADGIHHVTVVADGRPIEVRARSIVNAAGVWSDRVQELTDGVDPDGIRPAKGVHLTVPWSKVRNDIAVVIPVPKDKRSLFLVPWGPNHDGTFRHTYVGTTDTDYQGPLDDPRCTLDDVEYVLRALNASIDPSVSGGFTADDVTGVWAGLRPLVKSSDDGRTADLSRRHRVSSDGRGVVAVTGGKLTTYREMAEDAVDEVLKHLGRRARCRTRRLRLLGAGPRRRDVDPDLYARYGTLADEVVALCRHDPSLGLPLVAGLEYRRAEAVYAVRSEMARTLDDVLSRRTRARLFDRAATLAAAPSVAALLAAELGWDDATTERNLRDFVASCHDEAVACQVPETELQVATMTREMVEPARGPAAEPTSNRQGET